MEEAIALKKHEIAMKAQKKKSPNALPPRSQRVSVTRAQDPVISCATCTDLVLRRAEEDEVIIVSGREELLAAS